MGLGDVGSETWDAGTRGRDKQTTPDICAEFVEYNFRWSRESYYMLVSSSWFSASMVWPDMFACLFDRENSEYRIVSTHGVLKLSKTSWAARTFLVSNCVFFSII